MTLKRGLGRGLDALIKDGTTPGAVGQGRAAHTLPVDTIAKSSWQPRHQFDSEAMDELTQSVRKRGVLQPLLVRPIASGHELVAGERRLLAARAAGLTEVPVIIMDLSDHDALELALIENLQREDLNAIEEAEGYQLLARQFKLTQEEIATRVGKARASIANAVRILLLPEEIKQSVIDGLLSAGHAKALTGLEIAAEQILFARRAITENLSVRNLEKIVRKARDVPRKPRASRNDIPPQHLADLSDRLHAHFGTSVCIRPTRTYANGKKAKGTIEIDFFSNEDLDRILALLDITLA